MKSSKNRTQYWQEQIHLFNKSGLSQREYCRQSNIGYWSFNQWKRRIENNQKTPSVIEIQSRPARPFATSEDRVIISVNNNLQITIPATAEMINAIIKALGESTCK